MTDFPATSPRRPHRSVPAGLPIYRRWSFWFALVLIGVVASIFLWRSRGRFWYARWRDDRLLQHCEQLVRDGKLSDAAIGARRLLRQDPNHIRAAKIQAEVAEQWGLRDSVQWRERISMMDPSVENLLAWVYSALRFNDLPAARFAIEKFPPSERKSILYLEASGAVYYGLNDMARSEAMFAEALLLAPDDELRQLNLARARLQISDRKKREQARESLAKIPAASTNLAAALALLTVDALREGNTAFAAEKSAILVSLTNSPLAERMVRLDVLMRSDPVALSNQIEIFKAESMSRPQDLTLLLSWLAAHGQASSTLAWVRSQPAENFKLPGPGTAVADLYAAVGDWLGLRNWVRTAEWGSFNSFRYAYEAWALKNMPSTEDRSGMVEGLWQKAMDATEGMSTQMELLSQSAAKWGLFDLREKTLWTMVDRGSARDSALRQLYRDYLATDNAMGQYKVSRRLMELDTSNIEAKNNAVYLGLLLNISAPDLFRYAEDLSKARPADGAFVSTHAFALIRQDRAQDGIVLMDRLPEVELSRNAVALIYGYGLAKIGERDKARSYLQKAQIGKLLPDETKLLLEAKELARMR